MSLPSTARPGSGRSGQPIEAADLTLEEVLHEGVHVVPRVVEGDLPASAHHVEYVKAGGLEVPVDHVDVGDGEKRKSAVAGR